ASGKAEVMQSDRVKGLKIDKSSVQRRVAAALAQGVLRNLEDRKGRPSRLVIGEPLSAEMEILPVPERLQRLHNVPLRGVNEIPQSSAPSRERLHGCVANEGIYQQDLDREQTRLDFCSECGERASPGDHLIAAWEGAHQFLLHRLCAS